MLDGIKGDQVWGAVTMGPEPGLAENQRITKDDEELKMLQTALNAANKA